MKSVFIAGLLLMVILASCRKDSFITGPNAQMSTSADTLFFDTVFTSAGSTTQFLRIYNNNDQKLRLSNIVLGGGITSAFRMNVDGIAGASVNNVEIDANDSIYVFVTARLDPTGAKLPFVVRDSIGIEYNGNKRWVQLEAWGQNAHYLRSRLITGNMTWANDLPYVIIGGVKVDASATLTIEKGSRIYFHADAPLIVDGTLKVNGGPNDSAKVRFRGDRIDDPYRDYPAGWPGIIFTTSSHDNVLRHADISNAYQAIVATDPVTNGSVKLLLDGCRIDNAYDAGILGVHSSITAQNCLVSNCGKGVMLVYGGNYNFTHCTDAAFSNTLIQHKEPALVVTDYAGGGNALKTADMRASFTNCIFWGDFGLVDDEVIVKKAGNNAFNVNFQNCLWKVKNNPTNSTAANIIANQPPLFDSVNTQKNYYDFRLRGGSPAVHKGIPTSVTTDIDGRPRNPNSPDLGCYER